VDITGELPFDAIDNKKDVDK